MVVRGFFVQANVTDKLPPSRSNDPNRPAAPSGSEYHDILSGVIKDQKERKAAGLAAAKKQRAQLRGKGNQPLMLGILALVSGYLWLGEPAFLESTPLDPISVELSEASLRIDMTIFISKIAKFEVDFGRYPASLGEAWEGEERPTYVYEHGRRGFSLTGNEGTISLYYESTQDVVDFMGNAMRAIQDPGQ